MIACEQFEAHLYLIIMLHKSDLFITRGVLVGFLSINI